MYIYKNTHISLYIKIYLIINIYFYIRLTFGSGLNNNNNKRLGAREAFYLEKETFEITHFQNSIISSSTTSKF